MAHAPAAQSLNRVAFSATVHCLTGCAIGEVLGLIIGTALGWGNWETIVLAVVLAFFFGYSLTMLPLLRSGIAFRAAVPVALASDTVSITIMEIVDNLMMLARVKRHESDLCAVLSDIAVTNNKAQHAGIKVHHLVDVSDEHAHVAERQFGPRAHDASHSCAIVLSRHPPLIVSEGIFGCPSRYMEIL